MIRLVIDVHIGALHIRQALELDLQLLRDVVGGAQAGVGVHDDVDLDDEAGARVVGAHRVDLADGGGVGHGDVGDVLQHGRVGGDADQQLELGVGGAAPQEDDEDGEQHGAHGVDPPLELCAADAGENAEAVDEEVVAVVLPQDAHLAVLVAQRPAVQEEAELCGEGDGHGQHRGEVEVVGLGARVLGHAADRLDDDDHGHGDHQRAEGQVARRLDARLARGELARVHPRDGARAHDQREVGQGVEQRVGHGGEQRQRARTDGGVQLQHREQHVGHEGAHDGDLVLELVRIAFLLGRAPVVVHGLEQPFDVLVLRLVELLELLRIARLLVQADRPAAVTLAAAVGPDLRELRLGLDGGREVVRVIVRRVPWQRLRLDVAGAIGAVQDMAGAGDGVVAVVGRRGFDGGAGAGAGAVEFVSGALGGAGVCSRGGGVRVGGRRAFCSLGMYVEGVWFHRYGVVEIRFGHSGGRLGGSNRLDGQADPKRSEDFRNRGAAVR
ncbi:hypothetical protein B5807_06873 [Epicoccum nigrum]|uniref:Uncharacterized protein n=1 Tax=Epicoccum nigrum TaxID=105696 RepID=A0A1Y2M0I1_EPING|nr:hypothetical protein B5807_06873 [Epicoccum nigrum]